MPLKVAQEADKHGNYAYENCISEHFVHMDIEQNSFKVNPEFLNKNLEVSLQTYRFIFDIYEKKESLK